MVERPIPRRTRGTQLWVPSFLLVLIVISSGPTSWALEELPLARIAGVDSPSSVLPGENFKVVVAVDYSASYGTDIAILDAATGFVLASRGLIIPAGRNLFTFSLTGRDYPGTWALLATVRVWWHSGWYGNQNGGIFPFEITISDPTVGILNIRSNLGSLVVTVDGISHSVSSEGLELSTKRGLHTIEVESPLIIADGTRVVFDHWSDGVCSSSREIYLEDQLDLSAIYVKEFFLTVESGMGETVGSGWYSAGTNASLVAIDPILAEHPSVGLQVRYKFSHWSGDVQSVSPVGWVVMDRPRTVVANWSEDTSQTTLTYQLIIISLVFLSCSVTFIAIGVALSRRARTRSHYSIPRRKGAVRGLLLALVFLTTLAHSPAVQPTNALTLLQPESITIGDAVWYHWNEGASDTLLIWLGGGIVEQTAFLVNPYEFESYNTIRFIQDLARNYDVLALKEGSMRSVERTLNRTIFREPYPGRDNFMEKIRLWADEQGYEYSYVVGYSVGARAAAEELVLADPREWTSPDGLIIITTKIPEGVSSKAGSLRASLLLLYGEEIAPDFKASGDIFFQRAPQEGWQETFWYHKEYHVIPDVEHEVWTIRDSGEYDSRAVLLTVKFIETSKSLQFERARETISRTALNLTATTEPPLLFEAQIVSVKSPVRVRTGEAFTIVAAVRYDLSSTFRVAVVTFDIDTASIVSAAQKQLTGTGETRFVGTVLSGNDAKTRRLILIPLVDTKDSWTVVTNGIKDTLIDVSDSFAVTVITGYPNLPVVLDGENFHTGDDGEVRLNTTAREHIISVPPMIVLGNTSRAVFQHWNGTFSSPTLHLNPSTDLSLLAIYRLQYHLNVTSPFGETTGTGWYDEAATARFRVTPVLVAEETRHIFVRWSGDSNDPSPVSNVFMNDSKNIRAIWRELDRGESNATQLMLQGLFTLSSAMLLGSLIFMGTSLRSRRKAALADASQPPT